MKLKEILDVMHKETFVTITELAYFKDGPYYSFRTVHNGTIEEFVDNKVSYPYLFELDVVCIMPTTLYHDMEYRIGPENGLSIDIRSVLDITKEEMEEHERKILEVPGL